MTEAISIEIEILYTYGPSPIIITLNANTKVRDKLRQSNNPAAPLF
jgi:hypothetical protein